MRATSSRCCRISGRTAAWPRRYGVFNETTGFANRGTFLVDAQGIVRFAEMNGPGEGRDADQWLAAIKAL